MKRPRGQLARQAEREILGCIENWARDVEVNYRQPELAEAIRAKGNQIAARWQTQQRIAEERKSVRQD